MKLGELNKNTLFDIYGIRLIVCERWQNKQSSITVTVTVC